MLHLLYILLVQKYYKRNKLRIYNKIDSFLFTTLQEFFFQEHPSKLILLDFQYCEILNLRRFSQHRTCTLLISVPYRDLLNLINVIKVSFNNKKKLIPLQIFSMEFLLSLTSIPSRDHPKLPSYE